jgi:hypothetical protein
VSLQNAFSWVGVLHLLQALIVAAALTFLLRAAPEDRAVPKRGQTAAPVAALSGPGRWLWLLVAALAALLAMGLAP